MCCPDIVFEGLRGRQEQQLTYREAELVCELCVNQEKKNREGEESLSERGNPLPSSSGEN